MHGPNGPPQGGRPENPHQVGSEISSIVEDKSVGPWRLNGAGRCVSSYESDSRCSERSRRNDRSDRIDSNADIGVLAPAPSRLLQVKYHIGSEGAACGDSVHLSGRGGHQSSRPMHCPPNQACIDSLSRE